ncbi:MAG: hypothetical protein CMJ81_04175 [Planctomycetaceae bacterium]|nr:hypothetical protein [Planctomycetaceae bacterium]
MNNYLIRGGQLYDGSGDTPSALDLRIHDSHIQEVGPGLQPDGGQIIDATDLIVAPGLIDLHSHVFSEMGVFSVDFAAAGLKTGVTTLLDTGSAGSLSYPVFHRFIISQSREDIFALLNISQIGVCGHPDIDPFLGDLHEIRYLHVPSAVECIRKFPGRILGTKARLTSNLAEERLENELAALHGAIQVASQTGLFCMIHHVKSKVPLADVLGAMRPGDIYTHLFHPHYDHGFADEGGAPQDVMRRARDRGILFDVGHGVGAFDWNIAEPACQQHDFWPDTISTDIHKFNLHGPVFDLTTTMSKFLYLGLPLEKVIRATTLEPAQAMRLSDRFGRLAAGRQADVTLLRLEHGSFHLRDVKHQERVANQRLVPVMVFKNGQRADCVAPSTY